MKGEWAYYKSKYTKAQCEFIMNVAKSRPAQDAKIGVKGETAIGDHRKSKVRFVQPNDHQLAHIFDDIWKMAIQANNNFFNFHLSKLDYLQIAEYDGNGEIKGEYKKHRDVFYMNNDLEYHRKLSVIIQLSDPSTYEGGEFELYGVSQHPDASEIKTQGAVIFFPSFIEHAALPVTKGMRYSIAGWIDGPHWR
jgi:PKHD-type hydroxylase